MCCCANFGPTTHSEFLCFFNDGDDDAANENSCFVARHHTPRGKCTQALCLLFVGVGLCPVDPSFRLHRAEFTITASRPHLPSYDRLSHHCSSHTSLTTFSTEMALPTALRRGGAMVIDASGPALLVLFVVGGFAWVGGRRLRQQRPTAAQRRHGGNVGGTMSFCWCLGGHLLVYCWVVGGDGWWTDVFWVAWVVWR